MPSPPVADQDVLLLLVFALQQYPYIPPIERYIPKNSPVPSTIAAMGVFVDFLAKNILFSKGTTPQEKEDAFCSRVWDVFNTVWTAYQAKLEIALEETLELKKKYAATVIPRKNTFACASAALREEDINDLIESAVGRVRIIVKPSAVSRALIERSWDSFFDPYVSALTALSEVGEKLSPTLHAVEKELRELEAEKERQRTARRAKVMMVVGIASAIVGAIALFFNPNFRSQFTNKAEATQPSGGPAQDAGTKGPKEPPP